MSRPTSWPVDSGSTSDLTPSYQTRPRPAPTYPGTAALLKPGEPLRGPWFPQLYPAADRFPNAPLR